MSSNKPLKSKSLANVNNFSEPLECQQKSENKSGLGWLPWVKKAPKKYPTFGARGSPMSEGKGQTKMDKVAPKCPPKDRENSETPIPNARNLHMSNSGRLKNKPQMRSRILSLDSTTFEPPSQEFNSCTTSADPTDVTSISYPSTATAELDQQNQQQQKQQLQQQQCQQHVKPSNRDCTTPKKTCDNNFSSKQLPLDHFSDKTGYPVMSLAGVETSATHL